MITKLNQELFSLQKVSTCQGGSNWWDRFSHGSSSHNFQLCKRKVCFRPTMETHTAMLTQPQVRKNQLMPPRKGTPILLSIDRAMAYGYALARPIQLLASGLHFCQAGHLSPTTWTEHQHQQGALLLHHQHLPSLQHDRRCLLVLVLDRSQLSQYLSDYSQEMGKNVFQAPARVSLAVTTLLAMSTTMASIQVERKFNTKLEKNWNSSSGKPSTGCLY